MQEKNIEELIASHRSKGDIENHDGVTIIDDNLIRYNKYTLRLSRINTSQAQVNYYNAQVVRYLKTKTTIYKEIREFNQVFKFLSKLNITSGFIKKMETPDFELFKAGKSYGIEVTRIYTGNDWVAEKIHNDIDAYKLSKDTYKDYISSSKYANRVLLRLKNDAVKVEAVKEKDFQEDEIIQIKNKLFEKIRKMMDEYQKFDINYIFADVVYAGYKQIKSYRELSDEINYYISHLDVNFGNVEFHLVLKTGNKYIDFDIKNNSYTEL